MITNFTIPVPNGTTNHGQPGLVCVPPTWINILTFFATNYFAHAATVLTKPGQSTLETVVSISCALFVPAAGALRILRYLLLHPITISNKLQRAAAAGALCMVVRETRIDQPTSSKGSSVGGIVGDEEQGGLELQHLTRDSIVNCSLDNNESLHQGAVTASHLAAEKFMPEHTEGDPVAIEHAADNLARASRSSSLTRTQSSEETTDWFNRIFYNGYSIRCVPSTRKFHGYAVLPKAGSYRLIEVPLGTPLRAFGTAAVGAEGGPDPEFHAGSSYSFPKILIGLVQAIWAIRTLYETRGNQLELYGYAAFGLSVTPYAFMSIVNILASLVTPEYPTMFLVHTPDLDEAREAGGKFEGIIAAVDINTELDPGKRIQRWGYSVFAWTPYMPLNPKHKIKVLSCNERNCMLFLIAIFIFTPIVVVGGLSKFRPGSISTTADRGWLLSWPVIGSTSSLWLRFINMIIDEDDLGMRQILTLPMLLCPFFIPAVGGMVTVGKMLQSYGICTKIGQ